MSASLRSSAAPGVTLMLIPVLLSAAALAQPAPSLPQAPAAASSATAAPSASASVSAATVSPAASATAAAREPTCVTVEVRCPAAPTQVCVQVECSLPLVLGRRPGKQGSAGPTAQVPFSAAASSSGAASAAPAAFATSSAALLVPSKPLSGLKLKSFLTGQDASPGDALAFLRSERQSKPSPHFGGSEDTDRGTLPALARLIGHKPGTQGDSSLLGERGVLTNLGKLVPGEPAIKMPSRRDTLTNPGPPGAPEPEGKKVFRSDETIKNTTEDGQISVPPDFHGSIGKSSTSKGFELMSNDKPPSCQNKTWLDDLCTRLYTYLAKVPSGYSVASGEPKLRHGTEYSQLDIPASKTVGKTADAWTLELNVGVQFFGPKVIYYFGYSSTKYSDAQKKVCAEAVAALNKPIRDVLNAWIDEVERASSGRP